MPAVPPTVQRVVRHPGISPVTRLIVTTRGVLNSVKFMMLKNRSLFVSQPYYVDEDDFFQACDQNQLLVTDRYLSTGGDINACDAVSQD